MLHYFAYGSNMCQMQMQKRCPGSKALGVAHLTDHQLCFPQISPKRQNAGVASVKPLQGCVVEGIIHVIEPRHLDQLDFFEDLGWLYDRRELVVHKADDKMPVTCWIYLARADHRLHYPPSADYIGTILRAAKLNGLSGAYQDWLLSFVASSG